MSQADVPPVVPLLRGWLHEVCFFVSVPAGVYMVLSARSPAATVAALVYALGLSALFGVSAAYHRGGWSPRARARMRRADHATIFVMIAASYTPICVLGLSGITRAVMLGVAWTGGLAGVVLAATGVAERKAIGLVAYILLGWAAVATFPQLVRSLSGRDLGLIVAGGVLYTAGAVALGLRWPNPFPRVFGYHEVWHLAVVAAAVCHFIAIRSLVAIG